MIEIKLDYGRTALTAPPRLKAKIRAEKIRPVTEWPDTGPS